MANPEFTDWSYRLGRHQGRLERAYAENTPACYSVTDENQRPIVIDVPPAAYVAVYQNVNVTGITGLILRIRHKGSPDRTYTIQVVIAGWDAFTLALPPGDPLQEWRVVTVPCGKLAGIVPVFVGVSTV